MQEITNGLTTDEYQKLIQDNHNLIYHFLRKYGLEDNEFYDLAAIALCNAAATYRPEAGVTFAHYALTCMLNAWHSEYRELTCQCRDAARTDLFCEVGDGCLTTPDTRNFVNLICVLDMIERCEAMCTRNEKAVLNGMLRGNTSVEIAGRLGVSHQRIEQLTRHVRQKMKLQIA